jgi:hypothetical protein
MKTIGIAALVLGAAQLHAVTLISHYSNSLSTPQQIGSAAVAFTLPSNYVGVSLSARLYTGTGSGEFGTEFGTAYLLTALGPGTTPGVIATSSFSTDFKAGLIAPNIGLFSGLSLSAGTYYLLLQENSSAGNPMLWETTTDLPLLEPGVTSAINYVLNANNNAAFTDSFNPVDTLNRLQYRVDGRPDNGGDVPEPSSIFLLGLGAAGIFFRRR